MAFLICWGISIIVCLISTGICVYDMKEEIKDNYTYTDETIQSIKEIALLMQDKEVMPTYAKVYLNPAIKVVFIIINLIPVVNILFIIGLVSTTKWREVLINSYVGLGVIIKKKVK